MAFATLACSACGEGGRSPLPPEADARPNVVWILLDALRADHLGSYGYERPTSPAIDSLADRGVLLENTWAQAPATLFSVPSYMTGRYEPAFYQDPRHLDIWFLRRPPPEEKLVSSLFRENRYATAMFSASPWYSEDSRLGRSFDHFEPLAHAEGIDPRDAAANPALFRWIEEHAASPFFVYVHALDTHEPRYATNTDPRWLLEGFPPEREAAMRRGWSHVEPPFDARDREQIRALYDGGILVADAFVGELVEAVDALGLRSRTVFVVSSDHGELLGEDGISLGHPLHRALDELLRVPVVISGPGVPEGVRIPGTTRNADIVPTLVDLAGLEVDADFQGVSLVPFFSRPEELPERGAYARIRRAFGVEEPQRVWIDGRRKHLLRTERGDDPSGLRIESFELPDRLGAQRPVEEGPAARAVLEADLEARLRESWRPLRARVESMPLEVPPSFELGHNSRQQPERVARDRLDRRDGRWSDVILEQTERDEVAGLPFVQDRVLVGFPASEELPVLSLVRRIPDGRYRVSASLHAARALGETVSLRFRAAGSPAWRLVELSAADASRPDAGWVSLGEFAVEGGRFAYELAPSDSPHPALIGRLRFEEADAPAAETRSDAERQREIERLRSLGYVE